jgi:hypothetical protein
MSGLEFVQGLVSGALPVNSMAETLEGRLTDAGGRLLVHGTTTCLIFEY